MAQERLWENNRLRRQDSGIHRAGPKVHGFEKKGQAWFVATELQSDLVVDVDCIEFHLHKFPLLSRSGLLNRLVFESPDTEKHRISLPGLPGGPDAFELAAKFCYGMTINLTASNVAVVRCAAEYLEMTEDLEEDNLISKSEAFLTFVVLCSWKDSLTVLRSCEGLSPWCEKLQIVNRCSESIAWKLCTETRASPDVTASSSDASVKDFPENWWLDDVLTLPVDLFLKVVATMKVKGMKEAVLGSVVTTYAKKWIPGLDSSSDSSVGITNRRHMFASTGRDDFTSLQSRTQKLLESVVTVLPLSSDTNSSSFLLRLLRIANMYDASPACKAELERRVGMHLENSNLGDLLVPVFCRRSGETIYDVDLMERLLDYFLGLQPVMEQQFSHTAARTKVAKLLDGYLAEAARDPDLPLPKFQSLLEALPYSARSSDDGLYRAIDTYLKAHPHLTELQRKDLCRAMDCQKLSPDACLHASQNDRLPLRVIVQVLFTEHRRLRSAMLSVSKDSGGEAAFAGDAQMQSRMLLQELKSVKYDVEQIKARLLDLQQHAEVRTDKNAVPSPWFGGGWKKLRRFSSLFHDSERALPTASKFPGRRNSLS